MQWVSSLERNTCYIFSVLFETLQMSLSKSEDMHVVKQNGKLLFVSFFSAY